MNLDPFGVFGIAPNGTIFSYNREKIIIDSRQLTGDQLKALTGCDMVTPGMPPSANLETEKCLREYLTPGSDVSVKGDSELFGRTEICEKRFCRQINECPRDWCSTCMSMAQLSDNRVYGVCVEWSWP